MQKDDLISRIAVYDRVSRIVNVNHLDPEKVWFTPIGVKALIKELPSVQSELIAQDAYVRGFEQGRTQGKVDANLQPEEAIPVSWIEGKITRFIEMDNAFSGLTASIIRVMLNEWKKEQEGDTK